MAPPPSPRQRSGAGDVSAFPFAGSSPAAIPPALLLLPLLLSTLLLVLFAVVVNRQQEQAARVGDLMRRVQGLEHSRTLERTAVLEQQLRAMLSRLQTLEKADADSSLNRRLQALQEEVEELRSLERESVVRPEMPSPPPLTPPRPPRPLPQPITP